jgi:hypothetical protein
MSRAWADERTPAELVAVEKAIAASRTATEPTADPAAYTDPIHCATCRRELAQP